MKKALTLIFICILMFAFYGFRIHEKDRITALADNDTILLEDASDFYNMKRTEMQDMALYMYAYPAISYSNNYADLATAISTIGSANATLIINSSESLSDDATFPTTLSVKVLKPGCITIASGKELTINGPFEAGLYQVFDGDGTVVFGTGAVENIYPEWWRVYRDGINDDASAVDKAITACLSSGGHIVLTPGDWYWISTVPEIHEEIPEEMLIISGYGAVINLCNDAPTAFNLSSTSGNQTKHIQNILLEGYTVDAHDSGVWNATGGSMVGCIVTSAYVAPDYFYPTNTSYRDITIRDIIAKNVLETTHDTNTTGMMGIAIGLQATSSSTEISNILVDNVEVEGGRCAVLISRQGTDHTNTNTWLDDILINNVRHEISAEKSAYYVAANIMVGGGGRCGNVIISNCYGSNSGDVGIEIDCAENLVIKNTIIDNSRNSCFFIVNYAEPPNLEAQTVLLDGCTARYIDNTWDGGPGYKFHNYASASDIRQATLRDCKYIHDGRTNALSYGQYVQGQIGKLLTIDGFVVEDVCNFDGSYSTQQSLVGFNLTGDAVYISNMEANVTFNNNSSSTTMAFELIRETDVKHLVINGVDFDLIVSENPGLLSDAYLVRFGAISAGSDDFGGGSMKNVDANVNTGIDFCPICTLDAGNVTAKFVIENCDFDGVTDFAELVSFNPAAANAATFYSNLRFRQNDYPASEPNYASYNLIGAAAHVVKNDNFRKGHFFPASATVTLMEESYDHGSNYVSADDISESTLTEGSWARVTTSGNYTIDFYFADD